MADHLSSEDGFHPAESTQDNYLVTRERMKDIRSEQFFGELLINKGDYMFATLAERMVAKELQVIEWGDGYMTVYHSPSHHFVRLYHDAFEHEMPNADERSRIKDESGETVIPRFRGENRALKRAQADVEKIKKDLESKGHSVDEVNADVSGLRFGFKPLQIITSHHGNQDNALLMLGDADALVVREGLGLKTELSEEDIIAGLRRFEEATGDSNVGHYLSRLDNQK